ncbi:hypothetical protein [Streptacidiphilus rugosus]|uniref:hypothetical protein n=1 Tax=Streptacidiphilus rugosus TaxID=405783 RepID=UPI000560B0C7|nr:hypothetical protein [Streptacidiphilus rugosus]
MGRRKQNRGRASSGFDPVGSLIDGVEAVDLIEQVPGGWYEIASLAGEVRMEVREGHENLKITINGHTLTRDDPGARQVFEHWPSPFTAVLLVATGTDLLPGRYSVTPNEITLAPHSAFERQASRVPGQGSATHDGVVRNTWAVCSGSTAIADWSRWTDRFASAAGPHNGTS